MSALDDYLAETNAQAQQLNQIQPPGQKPSAAPPQAGPTPQATPAPPKPSKSPGFFDKGGLVDKTVQWWTKPVTAQEVMGPGVDNLKALGAGVLRAPAQFVGGLMDTQADAGKFIDDNIHNAFIRSVVKPLVAGPEAQLFQDLRKSANGPPTVGGLVAKGLGARTGYGASLADILSDRQGPLGRLGNQKLNQQATEFTASAVPFLAPGGGPIASATKAALGAAAAFTPHDQNNAIIERLNNAGAASAADMGLNVLGAGAKWAATKVLKASPIEGAADKLNRTFATKRTEQARYDQAAAEQGGKPLDPVEQEVVPPSRHSDTPATDAEAGGDQGGQKGVGGRGGRNSKAAAKAGDQADSAASANPDLPTVRDANAALEESGVAERIPEDGTHQVTPDGRFIVAPETKAALDEAGYGRAFAHTNEVPKGDILYKEEDPEGGWRIVGHSDAQTVQAFTEAVDHWRSNPGLVDVGPEHPAGQFSLSFQGPDDVPAHLRALQQEVRAKEPVTDASLLAKATAAVTGMDHADILTMAGNIAGEAERLPEGIATLKVAAQNIVERLKSLVTTGTRWADMDANSPEVRQAIEAIHDALSFHTAVNQTKSAAGRGLRLWGVKLFGDPEAVAGGLGFKPGDEIPPDMIPDKDAYTDAFGKTPDEKLPAKDPTKGPGLPRTPKELGDWMDAFNAASQMEDPKVLHQFLSGQSFSLKKWLYLRSSFANFFTASIVSAPRTFVRDLWGPGIVSGFNTVGRVMGSALQAIDPLLSQEERNLAMQRMWSAPRAHIMALSDAGDALKGALATVKRTFEDRPGVGKFSDLTGSNLPSSHGTLGGHSPLDFNTQGVPQALVHAATSTNPGVTGAVPFWAGNVINKWPQIVHALHGGVNDFAMRLAYSGEVRGAAYEEAAQQGLKGDDFDQYVRERVQSSTDPLKGGTATDDTALNQAQRTAFVKRATDQDPYWLQKAQEIRSTIAREVPETRFIMPIFTVPANALGEALRRIPVVAPFLRETSDELAGYRGVRAQADALGRMALGGTVMTAGYSMARSGQLTGAGPEDPHARDLWLMNHQPYSVRVGDKWYSYAKSDLMGPLLGLMATSYDRTVYESPDKPHGALAAVTGLAQYFKDQASLQGLSDLLNIGGNPAESDRIVTRLMGQTGSGFIPNWLKQAREQSDDLLRTKRTPFDYVLDHLPFESEHLDPVRNLLGEPVHVPHAPGANSFPVTMANASTWQNDPVSNELARHYQATGYSPAILPPHPTPQAHFDMRDIKDPSDGRSVYEHIMRHLPTVQNDAGQTLRQSLTDLITSEEYRQAPDGTGKEGDDRTETRGAMLQKVFSEYHKLAKQAAAQESPTVARYLAVAAAKQHDPTNLKNYDAGTLATDNGGKLMKSLGINIEDYEANVRGQ